MSGWRQRETKKVEAEKSKHIEMNEINFPSFSTSGWNEPSNTTTKKPGRSFASLAKEWNDLAEQEKIHMDAEEEKRRIEEYERRQIHKRRTTSYNFGTARAREEDTYYENVDDEYIPESTADTSDDWRTISKKIRKPRSTFDSPVFRPPHIDEDETQWDQQDYHE